jgi:hydroxymethylglutaryl-CoA synthase
MSVGIEQIYCYAPQYALPLAVLAAARGVAPEKLTQGLGVQAMAVAPACEDVVTLAATAAARCLRAAGVDPREIGLLVVATETGVDHAKPVGIFVHDLVGVGPHCRVYEVKHACYGGTAALMAAADWVRANRTQPRRALVVAADIARYALGSPGEPTQGAGAAAMLVGPDPRALFLSEESGVHAANVYDFWRPLDRREALVDGKYAIDCYLEALSGAFGRYRALERPALLPGEGLVDRLARVLYHTPFPKMAAKAHRRLLEVDGRIESDDAYEVSYRELVAPGLGGVSQIGNTYTASLYVCLASILEDEGRTLAGRRIGLFSYGSGSCAEFFTGIVPAGAATIETTGVRDAIARRTLVDVPTYERLLHEGERGGRRPADFTGEFVFTGVRDDRRLYERVREAREA